MLQSSQNSPAQPKEKVKQSASWKVPGRAGRQGQEEPLAGLLPAQCLLQAPRPRQSLGRRLQQGLVKQHHLFGHLDLYSHNPPSLVLTHMGWFWFLA